MRLSITTPLLFASHLAAAQLISHPHETQNKTHLSPDQHKNGSLSLSDASRPSGGPSSGFLGQFNSPSHSSKPISGLSTQSSLIKPSKISPKIRPDSTAAPWDLWNVTRCYERPPPGSTVDPNANTKNLRATTIYITETVAASLAGGESYHWRNYTTRTLTYVVYVTQDLPLTTDVATSSSKAYLNWSSKSRHSEKKSMATSSVLVIHRPDDTQAPSYVSTATSTSASSTSDIPRTSILGGFGSSPSDTVVPSPSNVTVTAAPTTTTVIISIPYNVTVTLAGGNVTVYLSADTTTSVSTTTTTTTASGDVTTVLGNPTTAVRVQTITVVPVPIASINGTVVITYPNATGTLLVSPSLAGSADSAATSTVLVPVDATSTLLVSPSTEALGAAVASTVLIPINATATATGIYTNSTTSNTTSTHNVLTLLTTSTTILPTPISNVTATDPALSTVSTTKSPSSTTSRATSTLSTSTATQRAGPTSIFQGKASSASVDSLAALVATFVYLLFIMWVH